VTPDFLLVIQVFCQHGFLERGVCLLTQSTEIRVTIAFKLAGDIRKLKDFLDQSPNHGEDSSVDSSMRFPAWLICHNQRSPADHTE